MRDPSATKDAPQLLPEYDESGWPILHVRMPPIALSAELFQAHLDACSQRYTRGQPFCMMIEMGGHPPLDAMQRKAVADRMMQDSRRFPDIMLGCALVVRSVRSRGNVTAINWIAKVPYLFAAFDDTVEAKKWLMQLLYPGQQ